MVYNGEVYNFLDLKMELGVSQEEWAVGGEAGPLVNCKQLTASGPLSGREWRGTSDTEVLLAGIEKWGLEGVLKKCVGMFALALWDRQERVLSLARDRMGEKPLYYGWQRGVLLFGSELKALRAHPAFESEIDRDVLPLYLRHGYIPAPWCIWRGIRKLTPGTWITVRASDRNAEAVPQSYWTFYEAVLQGKANPFRGSDQEAIDALETTLKQAVVSQMVADVPLGAFLSGGIDSSTVVALMQSQSSKRVKTFTIGFAEASYNEANHAKIVAAHLGTDHTEMYVTAEQAREVIPRLPQIYDEPFGDSSAIPTFLVSQLARQHVTVSLSGDGGDELFGGYGRYFNAKAEAIWKTGRWMPGLARRLVSSALRSRVPIYANAIANMISDVLGRSFAKSLVNQCSRTADLAQCSSRAQYYRVISSHWNLPPTVRRSSSLAYGLTDTLQARFKQPVEQMMAQDSVTYLPDDILVKVDRASMALSLESRMPLLDHRVMELAWQMPYCVKVRNGKGKWLLRQVLNRHVPQELTERPKMGFGVPLDQWLRGSLREWGENLLGEGRLEQEGYLDKKAVRDRWEEHQRGHHNWRDSLWLVLIWQAWLVSVQKDEN